MNPKEESRYKCPRCRHLYKEEVRAQRCCTVDSWEKLIHECTQCCTEYDDVSEAEKCHPHKKVDSVKVWICSKCKQQYIVQMEAVNCCKIIIYKTWLDSYGDILFEAHFASKEAAQKYQKKCFPSDTKNWEIEEIEVRE